MILIAKILSYIFMSLGSFIIFIGETFWNLGAACWDFAVLRVWDKN